MDLGINGRRAAVAAASAGLGRGCAEALAAEGVHVAICGRDRARLEEVAHGAGMIPLIADVSTVDGARGFVRDARYALGGPIDILVPNAGGPHPGGFADITDVEEYARAFELNALSTIGMCSEAVPEMRAQQWGRVVAITSIAVRQPIPSLILSNTARAGVTGFLKTLSREVAADGVTVNSLQPGIHDTDRIRQLGGREAAKAGIPAGTIGDPAAFGAICAFLCSEHARFLSGTAIPVDGAAYAGLLEIPVIRHVSVLTWTGDATAAQVAAVHEGLAALPAQIPEIRAYAFGPDLGLADGNAHLAIVADFDNTDEWRRYQEHPAHQAVLIDRIRPILASRAAVQYDVAS